MVLGVKSKVSKIESMEEALTYDWPTKKGLHVNLEEIKAGGGEDE